ncbi:D-alanyl-D-alanine carboxypeptidase/D-alanyl-D-alanine-endopeptidase [Mongoliibacter ruber]|uniref:D-alanyl-D-alanine carboxypeptidase/D-alanyl-D-alanine-endopeptidase (Penicillin-binding protein 4) n=1 Tax=Mongoliibacter ruber TaxID=1750599 RepID=A0A2T0WMY3_9BACT|nr:D-alanyl-D-alanine carboxypeptidase [Mongoliibacter ruber]PRY88059.1 D-alanyl-D-alanine carboxypeptidase/D-alanyl-D-alanine-endopeptidase (penicillin-binding protein 4) [Mongoliibacter ruber]
MIKKISFGVLIFSVSLLAASAQEIDVRERYEGLNALVGPNTFFDNHLTGFILYELDSGWVHFEKNSHMNFIPASTTKLFTFYASLMVLRDRTNTFRYVEKGDEITIWGSGDPSWKYNILPQPKIEDFLSKYKKVNFSSSNWKDEAFGYGWQWDDYYYAYSAERSPFPMYGNIVMFRNVNRTPQATIPAFANSVKTFEINSPTVRRDFHSNTFYYNPRTYTNPGPMLPFVTSAELTAQLLRDVLKKPVELVDLELPSTAKIFNGGDIKPLWKEMMQESDNFIAEQILLMVSDQLFGELNSERAIDYVKKTYLRDLPDDPKWVDGSGLSRHNLVTPRSMITLMEKIDKAMPRDQLLQLLPQGGINGTLKNNYKAPRPYIFAKTGTISNNHALVGIIKTDSGRHHAFAFLNNNYLNKASEIRREMEKVLLYIKANY